MPDEVNDFQADELETGGVAPATPETGTDDTQATPTDAPSFLEYGGRKFKSQDELGKAYAGLLRDYSRTKGEFAKAKPWIDFGAKASAHPELHAALNQKVQEYVKRLQAGQPQATAQRASGVPDSVAVEIADLRSKWEDRELRDEIAEVKAKFSPDEETLKKAMQLSYDNNGIPLELCLKSVMADTISAKATSSAEAKVREDLRQKRSANVGSSQVPSVQAAPKKPEEMSRDEQRAAVKRAFWPDKYGS